MDVFQDLSIAGSQEEPVHLIRCPCFPRRASQGVFVKMLGNPLERSALPVELDRFFRQ